MARPTEIKAVVAELMEPADDVTEVAKRVIAALDKSRQDRTDYLIVRQCGRVVNAFGPYATIAQCAKAIEGGKIPALDGSSFRIIPLVHPSYADRIMETLDEGGMSEEAMKLWEVARNGGQVAKTSTRRNRRRGSVAQAS